MPTVPLRADATSDAPSLWATATAGSQTPDTGHYGYHLAADGILGTPQPYTVSGDSVLNGVLLLCLVVIVATLAYFRRQMDLVTPRFFHASHSDDDAGDLHQPLFLLPLALVSCIMLSIASLICGTHHFHLSFAEGGQRLFVVVFTLFFAACFLLKWVVYSVVNGVLFGGKKMLQWNSAFLFIIGLQSFLLYPLVLIMVYFNIQVKNALICLGVVLILNKIAAFYKSWNIFFQKNGRFLQNILYFCALEIAPLLAIAGAWVATVRNLKVIF